MKTLSILITIAIMALLCSGCEALRQEAAREQAMHESQQNTSPYYHYGWNQAPSPGTSLAPLPVNTSATSFTPLQPHTSVGVGGGDKPRQLEAEPALPSGYALDQIRKGEGIPTGKTRLGSDGILWMEYKVSDFSGTTYWAPSR